MPRTHGYSLKGTRCYGLRAWGERGRINAIGELRDNQLLTVSLFEGTINTATFNSWIEHDLLPKPPKKSVVIMDDAAFHKDKSMQQQLIKAGVTLEYLALILQILIRLNINGLKLKTFVELLIVLLMSFFVSIVYNQFIVTRLYTAEIYP
ncbi:transposase [Legionella longbeachae]|uniref:transposase n=1 Tax=Legionella longbeachae TaxID=450 RepID=UPI000F6BE141|nr:transposase [Legionella longbeachae]UAK45799.1 transposase [Legionella longbeachae]VEE02742.1 transposase [Legionella oakridgensis]